MCVCVCVWVCHIGFGEGRGLGHKAWQHSDRFESPGGETSPNNWPHGLIFMLMPENLLSASLGLGGTSTDGNLCECKWDDRMRVVIHLFFSILFPSAKTQQIISDWAKEGSRGIGVGGVLEVCLMKQKREVSAASQSCHLLTREQ